MCNHVFKYVTFYWMVTPHNVHLAHVIFSFSLLWMFFYVIDPFTVKVRMQSESLGLMY